jgi:hypothetical protein
MRGPPRSQDVEASPPGFNALDGAALVHASLRRGDSTV